MKPNTKQLRNTLLLMLAAFIWGTAFVAQSVGSGYVGPYTFLASRSWLACLFLAGVMAVQGRLNKYRHATPTVPFRRRTLLVGGGLCGAMLFAASAAQQMAMSSTTAAKASFLTALYVVLVPVAGVFTGRRPGLRIWLCVAASVVGLYLLCMAGQGSIRLSGAEWLLLLGAFLFCLQILLVGHYSPQLDGVKLSFIQFLTTAILSTLAMFLLEQPTLAQLAGAAVSIAYCGIFSSGVAYTLQIVGQKGLDPAIASLAMCLESVFGALAGWVILGQTLTPVELAGCLLMFAAIVAAQLPDKPQKADSQAPGAERANCQDTK
ncbi:MAG: DMT family transporter [Gemmiger sp.]|nr:DMT family transporter [Gemmiger sp.]